MVTEANAINAATTGIVGNTGTAFTATAATNHAVLVGGSTTSTLTNLSVGATGTVLAGATGADPAFTATPTVTSITFGSGSALNTYSQAQSFTPVLNFGGATTGITYSAQAGRYTQIGNVIYYAINILLSSKGSATGTATLTGFPTNIGAISAMAAIGYWGNLTLTALYTGIGGSFTNGSGTTMTLFETGSAQAGAAMDNSMFANNSFFYFTGFYFTS